MHESVTYAEACPACSARLKCVGTQFLLAGSLEWGIEYHCSGCGYCEAECGRADISTDLRQRLLEVHGPSRLVLNAPMGQAAAAMKVLRAETGGTLAEAKSRLDQIRRGLYVGTMPEIAYLAERLTASGVAASAAR